MNRKLARNQNTATGGQSIAEYLLLLIFCFGIWAHPESMAEDRSQERTPSGQYCGIYSVYTAAKVLGNDVEFPRLAAPKYVGSPKGSSLGELERAASDLGLHALPVSNLSVDVLRQTHLPVILHVKSNPYSHEFDHFELYLGEEGGLALMYDAPKPLKREAFHDVARRWDGNALVLSNEPIDTSSLFRPTHLRFLAWLSLVLLLMAGGFLVKFNFGYMWAELSISKMVLLSMVQCLTLAIVAIFSGLAYHFLSETGFLVQALVNPAATLTGSSIAIRRVDAREVTRLAGEGALIVDARLATDYSKGHIEEAINIPVDSEGAVFQSFLTDIDPHKKIVLYCQNRSCPFAEQVASRLQIAGFTNLYFYSGGWQDWIRANEHVK